MMTAGSRGMLPRMNAQCDQTAFLTTDPARVLPLRDRIQSTTGLRRRVLVMFALAAALIVLLAVSVFITARRYRVLTDADHAKALARAETIRKATAELVVHYRSGTLQPATVSIGVATFTEHGDSPEALFRMADQALYRAKQLGRNAVASASDLARPSNARPVTSST